MIKTIKCAVMITLLAVFGATGCVKTNKYILPDELKSKESGEIDILTKDGVKYKLRTAWIKQISSSDTGRVISGIGHRFLGDGISEPFRGSIALNDISLVQVTRTNRTSFWLGLTTVGILLAMNIEMSTDGSRAESGGYASISYPAGGCCFGGSCPLIYTFDGDRYRFESETFAGAICRSLERTNNEALEHLAVVDGRYHLALTNQSPESHYVNEIGLLAADHPHGTRIIADERGALRTVGELQAPKRAYDFAGADALNVIKFRDGLFWSSDVSANDFKDTTDFRDGIICEFRKPHGASQAKLVIYGRNSELGYYALGQIFSKRGPNKMDWYHQLNTNPAERGKLLSWIRREGGLTVSVWNGTGWIEANWLADVGPRIESEKIITIDLSGHESETLKIRLESATDLWRLDRVAIDYTTDQPFTLIRLEMESAVTESGENVTDALKRADTKYYSTVPGNYSLLTFKAPDEDPDRQRTILLRSSGYYYTWTEQHEIDEKEVVDRILSEPYFGAKMYYKNWKIDRETFVFDTPQPFFEKDIESPIIKSAMTQIIE